MLCHYAGCRNTERYFSEHSYNDYSYAEGCFAYGCYARWKSVQDMSKLYRFRNYNTVSNTTAYFFSGGELTVQ